MVTYEVVLEVEAAIAGPLERYLRRMHIPEILATGCFREITFERASATQVRTRYVAANQVDLDRYLKEHAEHFRTDFRQHFPTGVSLSRQIWTRLEDWP